MGLHRPKCTQMYESICQGFRNIWRNWFSLIFQVVATGFLKVIFQFEQFAAKCTKQHLSAFWSVGAHFYSENLILPYFSGLSMVAISVPFPEQRNRKGTESGLDICWCHQSRFYIIISTKSQGFKTLMLISPESRFYILISTEKAIADVTRFASTS